MKYTPATKELMRNKLAELVKHSGLSANEFAVKCLGFSGGSKLNHILNGWNKDGLVGEKTWHQVEKYIHSQESYKVVATANLIKVWETCERAYTLKQACAIVGEGGFGKTTALEAFKKDATEKKRFTVYYFDARHKKTRKQFIAGLMQILGCYKAGTISAQISEIQKYMSKKDALLIIDEISSLKDNYVVIIKDIMDVLKDVCGIVFAGTPYFINNLNKGADKDKHLFSETRDRIFMLPERLQAPTEKEAETIFTANGITGEALDIVMGRNANMKKYSYLSKNTFRGVKDCIDMIQYVMNDDNDTGLKELQII